MENLIAPSTFQGKIAYAKQMCPRLKYITYKDFVYYFFSRIANFKQWPAGKKTNLRNILLRIANLPKYFWQWSVLLRNIIFVKQCVIYEKIFCEKSLCVKQPLPTTKRRSRSIAVMLYKRNPTDKRYYWTTVYHCNQILFRGILSIFEIKMFKKFEMMIHFWWVCFIWRKMVGWFRIAQETALVKYSLVRNNCAAHFINFWVFFLPTRLIRNCTFINFAEKFLPARLFGSLI